MRTTLAGDQHPVQLSFSQRMIPISNTKTRMIEPVTTRCWYILKNIIQIHLIKGLGVNFLEDNIYVPSDHLLESTRSPVN
jgi:hypothetical protein